jgi:hypothetical protein
VRVRCARLTTGRVGASIPLLTGSFRDDGTGSTSRRSRSPGWITNLVPSPRRPHPPTKRPTKNGGKQNFYNAGSNTCVVTLAPDDRARDRLHPRSGGWRRYGRHPVPTATPRTGDQRSPRDSYQLNAGLRPAAGGCKLSEPRTRDPGEKTSTHPTSHARSRASFAAGTAETHRAVPSSETGRPSSVGRAGPSTRAAFPRSSRWVVARDADVT